MEIFAELSVINVVILLFTSFIGSLLSASLGVGGGMLLLAVMADLVAPLALIPVHGMVQLGSNAGRVWLTRNYLNRKVVIFFILGAIMAAALALFYFEYIQPHWIPLAVAVFVLFITWVPLPRFDLANHRFGLWVMGFLTTLATMVVGATGPLIAALLGRGSENRWQYTANFSSCMCLQHLLKLVVFALAGFAFLPWLLLIFLMIIAGYLGTRLGIKLLGKLPEKKFSLAFKWIISAMSIRILWLWWT